MQFGLIDFIRNLVLYTYFLKFAPMEQEKLISYKGVDILRNSYIVLRDVNFDIFRDELVYIVGKVGSGKTSLIQTLYAELPISAGTARVLDFDLHDMRVKHIPKLRRKLGIVFQDFKLLPDRSIYDNLDFVLRATEWGSAVERRKRIEEVLLEVGLNNKSYKMPHELSGGEQQRVAIARSLLNNPDIILADEPTGNLDPETGQQIFELLRKIASSGKAVIISTHNHALIDRYPGRVLLCEDKKLCHLP